MNLDPAQEAINSALKGDWGKAVTLNLQILNDVPEDTEALNRLARAYAELGNMKRAKGLAKKVLKIDPFNSIASKSLNKWKVVKTNAKNILVTNQSSTRTFLEEPGRTKITSLLNLGEKKVVASLNTGDELRLNSRGHRVCVTTIDEKYIGRLTDDISARLRNLIKIGNEYEVLVKSAEAGSVKVFIKETKKSERAADIPSFPTEKIEYVSFTPPELVHSRDKISYTEEV